ncbi:MFS transporter [Candidatus Woesebacteria bacterium]|nr:MFS transporter [Candidatus Woesebacteria bacterium]
MWSSQILSQLTINIMNFLVLVHIYERTNSTIAASFIWVAYGIPAIIVGPVAAAAVDMYDRRRILFISNLTQALVVLAYAFLYQRFAYLSYGVVLAYSVMDQFYVPAESATLPSVVKEEELPRANGLFFISQQSAAILGFGLAGVISEVVGYGSAVLAGSILLFLAFIATTKLPRQKALKLNGRTVESKVWQFFDRMHEGYSFIRHRKTVLFPFLFLMWLQVSLAIMVVNMPVIGDQIVKTKPSLSGVLMVVPGGLGALIGTFIVSRVIAKVRKKKIIETALIGICTSFVLVSIVVPILPFWPGRLLLIGSFILVGISYVSALIPALTFMQTQTPKELMGRLFGNFWFLTTIATLMPVLFAAVVTELLGVTLLLVILGAVSGSIYVFSRLYLERSYLTIPEA